MTDTKQRKTGKAEMKSAVDSFLWTYRDATGGTREENYRGADHNLTRINMFATIVANLASNPSKPLLGDSHLMEYALELIPARVAKFRETYVGKYEQFKIDQRKEHEAQQTVPTNIIQFSNC